jgi:hypothetical protein
VKRMGKQRRKLGKPHRISYEWQSSHLSTVMLQVIKQAQKQHGISWTIQFNQMKNSIRIDQTMNGGFQITATDGNEEYVARITKEKKSYMVAGSEILFQRILQKKLSE